MEFEIKGQLYRSGKLDAFKQFHVARRLAPLLSGVSSVLKGSALPPPTQKHDGDKSQSEEAPPPAPAPDFADFLEPMADALAHMPDADCDFILFTCLGAAQRQQGNGWAKIVATGTRSLMFEDIDMGVMINITLKVIQENLGSFFSDPAASSPPKS